MAIQINYVMVINSKTDQGILADLQAISSKIINYVSGTLSTSDALTDDEQSMVVRYFMQNGNTDFELNAL